MRTRNCKFLRILFLISFLSLNWILIGQPKFSDWLGWRGNDKFGSDTNCKVPTKWDFKNNTNIKWVKKVEGTGHSSPITDGNFIYITSSSESQTNKIIHSVFLAINLFLVLLLFSYTFRIFYNEQYCPNKLLFSFSFFSLFFFLNFTVLLIILIGNGYFNFSRCTLRSWFISNVIYLFLSSYILILGIKEKQKINTMLYIAIALFPIYSFAVIPNKAHIFMLGIFGRRSLLVIMAIAIPLLLNLFIIIIGILKSKSKNNIVISKKTLNQNIVYLIIIISGLSLSLCCFLKLILQGSDMSQQSTFLISIQKAFLFVLIFFLIISGAFALFYKNQRKIFSFLALLFLLLSWFVIFGIIERIISHLSFFKYQLSNQKLELPVHNTYYTPISFIFLFVLLCICAAITSKYIKTSNKILSIIFLGITFFLIFQINHLNSSVSYNWNVLCYEINDGKLIWKNNDISGTPFTIHKDNSLATPTPVISDNKIISNFGTHGVICVRKSDGKTLWLNSEIKSQGYYGAGSSPIVRNNTIFLFHNTGENPLVSSIDINTGKIIWQTKGGYNLGHPCLVYRPPFIKKISEKEILFCASTTCIDFINIETGIKEYSINFESLGSDPVSSIIPDNQNDSIIFLSGKNVTIAINLNKLYNENYLLWRKQVSGSNVSSPVIFRNYLFTISDNGFIHGFDKSNGNIIFTKRLSGFFYSSLTVGGQFIYISNLEGITYIGEISKENQFLIIGSNDLKERIFSSPAISNTKLILRGEQNLYVISK